MNTGGGEGGQEGLGVYSSWSFNKKQARMDGRVDTCDWEAIFNKALIRNKHGMTNTYTISFETVSFFYLI